MAQPQQNIHIAAPGFAGLNTQDSPVGMDITYASRADNCIIDKQGRVASRLGFQAYTYDPEKLTDDAVVVQEFVAEDGTEHLFVCADGYIYSHVISASASARELDPTPSSGFGLLDYPTVYAATPTSTDNNWQIVPFNNKCFFVQAGFETCVFTPGSNQLTLLAAVPSGPTDSANVALAAFGHLFLADFDDDKSVIHWSDIRDGTSFGAVGNAGSLDLANHWPLGFDEVVALGSHNNFLIVFGRRSILIYNVPEDGPIYTSLEDTVVGIGCVARDSVQNIGTDVYFLDATGVRTFNRTVQEKSVPIGDISANVKADLRAVVSAVDNTTIKSMFHPEQNFYALFFPTANDTFVFDTRVVLENGANRTTKWPNNDIRCGSRSISGNHYLGGTGGVYEYTGADDTTIAATVTTTAPINIKYYTHPQTFQSPANLKFPKQVDVTLIGSTSLDMSLKWGFDYTNSFNTIQLSKTGGMPYYYGTDLYGTAKFSGAESLLFAHKFNVWGSGNNVTFGFEAAVQGSQFSIQEINLQALVGRLL